MMIMETIDLKAFRKINKLTQIDIANYLGVSRPFVCRIESGQNKLPEDKLIKLINNDQGWIIPSEPTQVIIGNSGVSLNMAAGSKINNSPIDNRHYYSDPPDVLRAQIELLDERIKEKDAQIKEKDAQIKALLDILKNNH